MKSCLVALVALFFDTSKQLCTSGGTIPVRSAIVTAVLQLFVLAVMACIAQCRAVKTIVYTVNCVDNSVLLDTISVL